MNGYPLFFCTNDALGRRSFSSWFFDLLWFQDCDFTRTISLSRSIRQTRWSNFGACAPAGEWKRALRFGDLRGFFRLRWIIFFTIFETLLNWVSSLILFSMLPIPFGWRARSGAVFRGSIRSTSLVSSCSVYWTNILRMFGLFVARCKIVGLLSHFPDSHVQDLMSLRMTLGRDSWFCISILVNCLSRYELRKFWKL